MSEDSRRAYLASTPGEFDEIHRRLHLFCDSPNGGDATSMLYLRLFEDTEGHTIAASHSARKDRFSRAGDFYRYRAKDKS